MEGSLSKKSKVLLADGDPNLRHAGGGCHPALLMGGRAAHPKTRGLHEMHEVTRSIRSASGRTSARGGGT